MFVDLFVEWSQNYSLITPSGLYTIEEWKYEITTLVYVFSNFEGL